jgi:hypothetical protein
LSVFVIGAFQLLGNPVVSVSKIKYMNAVYLLVVLIVQTECKFTIF